MLPCLAFNAFNSSMASEMCITSTPL
jgi:hypothetical protein